MLEGWPGKQWWYPPDFMPPTLELSHPHFIGYEASARLSELAKDHPGLIESRRKGKYTERRIRMEAVHGYAESLGSLPFGFFLRRQLATRSISEASARQPGIFDL